MATTYQLTRDQLSTEALSTLGVLAQGQVPSSDDLTKAALKINMLMSWLRTIGLPLWKRTEYTFTPTAGNYLYTIGNGQLLDTPYPLKVEQAFRVDSSNTSRIPIEIKANNDFNILPVGSSGDPIQLTYQPFINYGQIKLWPTPDAGTNCTITMVYQASFNYMLNASDPLDFPEEWYLAIVYKLAVLLAPDWGIPIQDRTTLKEEANEYLMMAQSFGIEDGSMFIQPYFIDNC